MSRYQLNYSPGSRGRYDDQSDARHADPRYRSEAYGRVRPAPSYSEAEIPEPKPLTAAEVRKAKVAEQRKAAAAARKAKK